MQIYFTAFVLIAGSASADAAGGYVEGKVKMLLIGSGWTAENVYVLVEMDTAVVGQPACATDSRLALNPATEFGRALYAMLLSAKHAQATVELIGAGQCDVMGTEFESLTLVRLK